VFDVLEAPAKFKIACGLLGATPPPQFAPSLQLPLVLLPPVQVKEVWAKEEADARRIADSVKFLKLEGFILD
jgi:hypothetical protein